ncbi:MAG TPA: MurR/RpiR family transcriptional regulator [Streptosporangiales bacterium]
MSGQVGALPGQSRAVGVLARVQGSLEELTGALRAVGERVLADPVGVAQSPITELARASGTSPGTVTRFCRAIGLAKYADLRFALAAETGRAGSSSRELEIGTEIAAEGDLSRVLAVIASFDIRAIELTAARLDLDAVDDAVGAISSARRVELFAVGGSAIVAEEMRLRLGCIGVVSSAWSEVHNGLTSAALLGPGDVAFGISNTGQTNETLEMLQEASSHGATTIALTNSADSPLARIADIKLTTLAHETSFQPRALAARHAQLTVLDLVYVAVAQRRGEQTTRALELTAKAIAPHREPEPRPPRGRRGHPRS